MENSSLGNKEQGVDSGQNSSNRINYFLPVRIAIYDNMKSIPRITDFSFNNIKDFINETSQKAYSFSHEIGGKIPYTIIREIIENLIHADFKEAIITIMDSGNHIVISDQGPGIDDKEKAFLPGYTSASSQMKEYIRGVGSGLPIVKETITFSGGSIDISDNLKKGTVISLKIEPAGSEGPALESADLNADQNLHEDNKQKIVLNRESFDRLNNEVVSDRQRKILFLILELEEAGPSTIARELGFSLSTSFRELILLEKSRLLFSNSTGKRKLSKKGIKFLEYYSNNI